MSRIPGLVWNVDTAGQAIGGQRQPEPGLRGPTGASGDEAETGDRPAGGDHRGM